MGQYALPERRRRERIRAIIMEARNSPCVDCGIQLPPECMDLDHVRGEKLFALNVTSAKRFARAIIEAEIAKCDVRCPNCHRLRHHAEDRSLHQARCVAGGGSARLPVEDEALTGKRAAFEARRERARAMIAEGAPREDVAAELGVKVDTLRRRYGC